MLDSVELRPVTAEHPEDAIILEHVDPVAVTKLLETPFFKETFSDGGLVLVLALLVYRAREAIRTAKTVISDDSSGRLPAILFWHLARQTQKDQNLREGKTITFVGVPGGDYSKEETERIGELVKTGDIQNPAIIMTEQVDTGNNMASITRNLKTHKIAYTPVTVAITEPHSVLAPESPYAKTLEGLIVGTKSGEAHGSFHAQHELSGFYTEVVREEGKMPHVNVHMLTDEATGEVDFAKAEIARRDMETISKALLPIALLK